MSSYPVLTIADLQDKRAPYTVAASADKAADKPVVRAADKAARTAADKPADQAADKAADKAAQLKAELTDCSLYCYSPYIPFLPDDST